MKIKILLPFSCLVLLAACGNDDVLEDPMSFEIPAKLEVQVRRCVNQVCDSLVQVPGTRVLLFEHEQYRSQGIPIAFDGTTDGLGKVSFAALDSNEYWLSIKLPPPDGRAKSEYVKTPKRTTSFLDVIFTKN